MQFNKINITGNSSLAIILFKNYPEPVLVRKYCLAEIIVNNLAKACGQADLIQISMI
jgi:hypothetical protein